MSAADALVTAGAVVAVGAVAAVAYAQVQKGRALGAGASAAQKLAAAGGDPSMLSTILDTLRAEGGETGGAAAAAGAIAANDNAGTYGVSVLDGAREAMRRAGRPSQLFPNLRVVRPKDKPSQWRIGEGAWLPSEGATQGWRESPVSLVRGLDLGYALTYLPDVYPAPAGGGAVVAYPARYGYHRTGPFKRATDAGLKHQFDVMITSTAQQGGLVAFWDPARGRWVPGNERVIIAVQWPAGLAPAVVNIGPSSGSGQASPFASDFLLSMSRALEGRGTFVPYPQISTRLVSKRA